MLSLSSINYNIPVFIHAIHTILLHYVCPAELGKDLAISHDAPKGMCVMSLSSSLLAVFTIYAQDT